MIKLKTLTLKNFMSIGSVSQSINFDGIGLTLILGENLDLGGDGNRNGSGKSSILNALSYALYGSPIGNIKKDNLVNRINNKNMVVSLEFECNNKKYRVERGRKPTFLRYFVDDGLVESPETSESQGENKWTQTEIEKAIGLSYIMFRSIVALTTNTEAFLRTKASEQREIIEELLGITLLSQKSDVLKDQIKGTKEKILQEEMKAKLIIDTNSRIQKSIDELLMKIHHWDRVHQETIATLTKKKSTLQDINFDYEISQFDKIDVWVDQTKTLTSEIQVLERDIKKVSSQLATTKSELVQLQKSSSLNFQKQKERLLSEIDRNIRRIEECRNQMALVSQRIKEVKAMLGNHDSLVCQTCNQVLKDDQHRQEMIDKLQSDLADLNQTNIQIDSDITKTSSHLDEIQSEILNLEKSERETSERAQQVTDTKGQDISQYELTLTHLRGDLTTAQSQLSSIGGRPKTLFDSRNQAYQTKETFNQLSRELEVELEKINPHAEHLETMRRNLQTYDYAEINDLNRLKDHQDVLLKLLTSKDSFIRKKIIDQNLAFLNNRLKFYLEKLNLPHDVKFMNDLGVEISKLGQDFDFDSLSNGEQLRVVIALNFAFRDVWEAMNTSINLLFIDEVIDAGMDPAGVESVLELLKKNTRDRQKNIYLISHREELISRVSNVLVVVKENGFTSISTDFESVRT